MFCQNGNPWTTFEANTTLLNYIFFPAIAVIYCGYAGGAHNTLSDGYFVASGRSAAWFRVNSVVQVVMLSTAADFHHEPGGQQLNPFLYFQF